MSSRVPADLGAELRRIDEQSRECGCKLDVLVRAIKLRKRAERHPWRWPRPRADYEFAPAERGAELVREAKATESVVEDVIAAHKITLSLSVFACGQERFHLAMSAGPRCLSTRDLAVREWILMALRVVPGADVYEGTAGIVHVDWRAEESLPDPEPDPGELS